MDPRRGYVLAVLNMVISGVAIYVNSLGVKMFADAPPSSTIPSFSSWQGSPPSSSESDSVLPFGPRL